MVLRDSISAILGRVPQDLYPFPCHTIRSDTWACSLVRQSDGLLIRRPRVQIPSGPSNIHFFSSCASGSGIIVSATGVSFSRPLFRGNPTIPGEAPGHPANPHQALCQPWFYTEGRLSRILGGSGGSYMPQVYKSCSGDRTPENAMRGAEITGGSLLRI